mmetsp:Transcript_10375/g.33102  ORF Transcript_10375/g.33102 Transcript_10375/m.33102 type:complete len:261 (-) Transcript_10375:62-844(-)
MIVVWFAGKLWKAGTVAGTVCLHLAHGLHVDALNVVLVDLVDELRELVNVHVVIVDDSRDGELLDAKGDGNELVLQAPVLDALVLNLLDVLGDGLEVSLGVEGLDLEDDERALALALASLAGSLLGGHLLVEGLAGSNVLLSLLAEEIVVIEGDVVLLGRGSGLGLGSGPGRALSLGEGVHVVDEAGDVAGLLLVDVDAVERLEELDIGLRRREARDVAAGAEEAVELAHAGRGVELVERGEGRHCGERGCDGRGAVRRL